MVRIVLMDREAMSQTFRRFSSKLCLFYLLWAYSPPFPSRTSASSAATTGFSSTSDSPLPSSPTMYGCSEAGGIASGSTEAVPVPLRPGSSPVTPPFEAASPLFSPVPPREGDSRTTALPVLERTPSCVVGDVNSNPPLSPAPSPSSDPAQVLPIYTPSTKAEPLPASERRPLLTPLAYTLLLFQVVFLLEYLVTLAGTALNQALLANPLPPAFSAATSRDKTWSRLVWYTRAVWKCCGEPVLGLLGVVAAVVTWILGEVSYSFVVEMKSTAGGWNAVPLVIFAPGGLRMAEGFAGTEQGARVIGQIGGPFRWVIGIQIFVVFLQLFSSALPLLLALRLVPSTAALPALLQPNASSLRLRLPLTVLAAHLFRIILSLSTLIQILVVFLTRFPKPDTPIWRRWLSLDTLVSITAFLSPFKAIQTRREEAMSEVEKVLRVIADFGLPWEYRLQKDAEDERCSICFEGDCRDELEKAWDKKGWKNWDGRCVLPCRHSFHASHLGAWLSTQYFCPTCHHDIRRRVSRPRPPPSSAPGTSRLSTRPTVTSATTEVVSASDLLSGSPRLSAASPRARPPINPEKEQEWAAERDGGLPPRAIGMRDGRPVFL